MSKKIYIEEDKLMGIKRFMTGENAGHKPFIAEDEPPYEKDEFEIGGEGGNNDFFHVNEGYTTSRLSNIDLSEVGRVEYQFDFDEDEYKEWLEDNELVDSEESKLKYYTEEYLYEVTYYDNQTYHYMDSDQMVAYDDLEELFGEGMAKEILKTCMTDGSGYFETEDLYSEGDYDINNPQELNDIAMKLLPHGEYLKGCRGFILSNGVVVYTEGEHNDVLRIPGINDKWQFIKLGNIRLLPNSIDIGSEPTYEQEEVLRYMLRLYDDEEIYLDIFSENGEIGAHYPSADCNYIMGEINRYYSEGIRPQGGGFYESKESDKKILVSEKQLLTLKENTFENWFGNSILKDENGEPIKMYHGTDTEFDSFSKKFIGKTGAHEGYGFNFTPYESRARSYNSNNVIEAYLKVENPMTTGSYNITSSKLAKIISEIDKGVPYTDTIVAAYEPTRYNENWDERYYRRALPVVVRQLIQYNRENEYGDAGIYADICLCGNGDKLKVIDTFEKLGYDSVIFYDNYGKLNTVVVFEPNQIKRTNNKTFSIDSDVMNENIETEVEASEVKLVTNKTYNNDSEIMSENKLDEHHSDQRLPFEEPSIARKRYIEQYVDWLEEFGRYGELPPSTLDFWEEIKKAIDVIRDKKLHGRFDSNFPFNKTDEEIFNELKNKIIGPEIRFKDGKVVVEREVRIQEDPSWYNQGIGQHNDDLYNKLLRNFNDNVGGCWSYSEGGGNSYCADSGDENYILLCGLIRTDDIDFVKTVQLNYHYPEEFEIRVKPFAKIELDKVHYSVNGHFGKCKEFNRHLIVNATYSGNGSIYHGEFGQIDDGFGNITLIDRNRNIINKDNINVILEKYLEDKNVLEKILRRQPDSHGINLHRDYGTGLYAISFQPFVDDKYNFYDSENNKILLNKWLNYVSTYGEDIGVVMVGMKNDLESRINYFNIIKKHLVSDKWFKFGHVPNRTGVVGIKNDDSTFDYFDLLAEKMLTNQHFDRLLAFSEQIDGEASGIAEKDGKLWTVTKYGITAKKGMYESTTNKKIFMPEVKLLKLKENIESEVESSEIKLDSFKKKNTLAPKMWDGFELDSRARLKLLDIADDFWDFANITWVKRKGIHLTGSICNFNWSKFSDIDLHIVVDFSEVDERKDFVQEYFDGKKNEWNSKHSKLKIYGYPVELYVEDVDAETASEGLYDLEKNEWIKKPNPNGIKSIGLDKYEIKDKSAELMTAIDDLNDEFNETDDDAKLRKIGEKAHDLYDKIKKMRKSGLERGGENDPDNIAYKVLRRSGYMDTLRTLSSELYDKVNSIDLDETVISLYAKKYVPINEEVVADGNADHNPFKKRWKYERDTLKNYLVNYGELMTSKENGKQYKVLYDQFISGRLGINYCLCIQWNSMTNKPGNIIYVRAFDKFTRKIFKPEFDTRGFDNQAGTADDLVRY